MGGAVNKKTTTVLIGLAVVAVAALSPIILGKGYLPWAPAQQEKISGQVSCQSDRAVVGIWVAQATGVGMLANRIPDAANPSTVGYHATIPEDVAYELHVGCGGTPQDWSMSASSSTTTAVTLTLRCHDVEGDPAYGTCS
jgi:hypothetical protein